MEKVSAAASRTQKSSLYELEDTQTCKIVQVNYCINSLTTEHWEWHTCIIQHNVKCTIYIQGVFWLRVSVKVRHAGGVQLGLGCVAQREVESHRHSSRGTHTHLPEPSIFSPLGHLLSGTNGLSEEGITETYFPNSKHI